MRNAGEYESHLKLMLARGFMSRFADALKVRLKER
jgi:hypothetical protein